MSGSANAKQAKNRGIVYSTAVVLYRVRAISKAPALEVDGGCDGGFPSIASALPLMYLWQSSLNFVKLYFKLTQQVRSLSTTFLKRQRSRYDWQMLLQKEKEKEQYRYPRPNWCLQNEHFSLEQKRRHWKSHSFRQVSTGLMNTSEVVAYYGIEARYHFARKNIEGITGMFKKRFFLQKRERGKGVRFHLLSRELLLPCALLMSTFETVVSPEGIGLQCILWQRIFH